MCVVGVLYCVVFLLYYECNVSPPLMEVKIRHAFLFEPKAPLDPPIFSSAKKLNRFAAKKKLMALVPL